ncbi:OmpA family protein [Actinomycetota bacterium]
MTRYAAAAVLVTVAMGMAGPAYAADPSEPGSVTPEQLGRATHDLTAAGHGLDATGHDLEAKAQDIESEKKEGSETVVTLKSDILFAFGKADVNAAAAKRIGDLVAKAPKGVTVSIGGHTDAIGSDASNRTLSQRRAAAVAKAITDSRSDLKVDAKGYGESNPVAPNESGGEDDPEGRAKNRRVEIRYSG